jgi:hypothetical protein
LRIWPWLLAAALLGGCATTFEVVDKQEHVGPGKTYTAQLPLNWVKLAVSDDRIVVTRDGFGLQHVSITRRAAQEAFPNTKKGADDKLLPSELAELQIAELKAAGEQLANLAVAENIPAGVGGRNGFRLHVRFKSARGLDFEEIHYGVAYKGYYYLISFHAPRLYYFEKYRPDFERTAASFRLAVPERDTAKSADRCAPLFPSPGDARNRAESRHAHPARLRVGSAAVMTPDA